MQCSPKEAVYLLAGLGVAPAPAIASRMREGGLQSPESPPELSSDLPHSAPGEAPVVHRDHLRYQDASEICEPLTGRPWRQVVAVHVLSEETLDVTVSHPWSVWLPRARVRLCVQCQFALLTLVTKRAPDLEVRQHALQRVTRVVRAIRKDVVERHAATLQVLAHDVQGGADLVAQVHHGVPHQAHVLLQPLGAYQAVCGSVGVAWRGHRRLGAAIVASLQAVVRARVLPREDGRPGGPVQVLIWGALEPEVIVGLADCEDEGEEAPDLLQPPQHALVYRETLLCGEALGDAHGHGRTERRQVQDHRVLRVDDQELVRADLPEVVDVVGPHVGDLQGLRRPRPVHVLCSAL
mmetsp:Transcript_7112/g.21667  ORF Transcript_7112/g.21667 Transcript_7112/m.21667 type:complete len:351 (-) Transcript_7112:1441-2493(-)